MAREDPIPDDARLITLAQQGDTKAFSRLVEKYRDAVFGLAARMTRSTADAAEITQETFLSAYQHLADFRGDAALGSWLHRIAANQALMRLRHRKVVDAAEEELSGPEYGEGGLLLGAPGGEWSRRADEQVLDAELRDAIQASTDRLPEGYREVFLLKDVDGMSYEAIAELLDLSVPAVKSRLHRARLALREELDAFYNRRGGETRTAEGHQKE